jgi:predicted transcriptional regulator
MTEIPAHEPTIESESATKILGSIQKGFDTMAKLIDFCGPELIDERRKENGHTAEMDVPAALRTIDKLIDAGYIERENQRFADQLSLRLTDAGRDIAPDLSSVEQELLEEHGVSIDALRVLQHVIKYEEEYDDQPFMEQLLAEYDLNYLAHQVTVLYNQLVESGLAEEKGIFRFWIRPTDEGRQLVREYEDQL